MPTLTNHNLRMDSLQLPLDIQLNDDPSFSNFYPHGHEALIADLKKSFEESSERFFYLWGKPASGKSHLLQATCREATERQRTASYIPLCEHTAFSPDIFDDLENLNLVCVDDIDAIATQSAWENALFHLYNRCLESKTRLIVAGLTPPKQLSLSLADLTSRLSWGMVYQIHELDDAGKLAALMLRAENRGLSLSDEAARYLLTHCKRDLTSLFQTLAQLDYASLACQRRLTIPFVKAVLGL